MLNGDSMMFAVRRKLASLCNLTSRSRVCGALGCASIYNDSFPVFSFNCLKKGYVYLLLWLYIVFSP